MESKNEYPSSYKNKQVDEIESNSIEYWGAVMDEETRPLFMRYLQTLKDGEGVIVVFRQAEGTSTDVLLEANIQQMTGGRDWDFISGRAGDDRPLQVLVDKLSEVAMGARVPNMMLSQGGAKIKASDTHKIAFGIVGNGSSKEITRIKGIVHQQLNMGLNGALLMHEADIIMRALTETEVLKDRALTITTYGAGGSSSAEVNPGHMQVSDCVIDIRTQVDPRCLLEHFDKLVKAVSEDPQKLEQLNSYKEQLALIIKKMKLEPVYDEQGNPIHEVERADGESKEEEVLKKAVEKIGRINYTGIEMVHDITELARKAAIYTNQPLANIMEGMNREDKRYYSEITLGSINNGMTAIHRIELTPEGTPFLGDAGQAESLKNMQFFLQKMLKISSPEAREAYIKANQEALNKVFDRLDDKTEEIKKQRNEIEQLLKESLPTEKRQDIKVMEAVIEAKSAERWRIKESIREVLVRLEENEKIFEELESLGENPIRNLELVGELEGMREELQRLDNTSLHLTDDILKNELKLLEILTHAQENLKDSEGLEIKDEENLSKAIQNLALLENEAQAIETEIKLLEQIQDRDSLPMNADTRLKEEIEKTRRVYSTLFPDREFHVTASGNVFFTEHDKAAVGIYGARTVEMENQLFVEIVRHLMVANRIYVASEYITKIAADPLVIEEEISERLNEWAKTHTMTVNDYVEAYMWASKGQDFTAESFPESGRWDIAEQLFNEKPEYQQRFYNFGTPDEPKIINPFWKEIGTDLVKEIADGKAFSAFGPLFKEEPFLSQKVELQRLALKIINEPSSPDLEANVRQLFTNYLNLEPMKTADENKFKVYARYIPVLKQGFVNLPLSDWDQPLYKSTNTAVLDRAAAMFVEQAQAAAKATGAVVKQSVILSDEKKPVVSQYHSAVPILAQMRKKNYAEAYKIGKDYLEQQINWVDDVKKHKEETLIDQIREQVEGIKEEKLLPLLQKISSHSLGERDPQMEKFIKRMEWLLEYVPANEFKQIEDELRAIEASVTSPAMKEIEIIIKTLREESNSLFAIGKGAKATNIELAVQQLPLEKREHAFEDPTVRNAVQQAGLKSYAGKHTLFTSVKTVGSKDLDPNQDLDQSKQPKK